ncbi:MAG: multi-sensor hybrid histidine kinase [Proteobacteria bacterium]|nr:multi-sensor hybrid histidine kinase [Pseudomonadota bacterium]
MQKVWRPNGSLTGRMRWLVGLTAVSAMLAASVLSSTYVFLDRSSRLAEKAGLVAGRYRTAAAAAASSSDETAARAVLRLAVAESGAHAASINGDTGLELAATGPAAVRSGQGFTFLPDVVVEVPLETEFGRVGTLRLSLSRQPAVAAVLALLPGQALALVLALGLAVLATQRMRATITRPIEGLLDTMQRVAHEHDYSLRAQPDGPEEIGSLINSFNEMLGHTRERDERLAEHRRQLQELVIERTRNLEEAAREAEHSSRAKGDFLARMSHEIRTPMNGVVGMAELLQQTPLDARQLRMLQTMRRSADALLEIINDILDFSKIEAGRLQVISDDFAPAELVEEVCELLASRAQERGLELVCDIDASVPAFGNGDPVRLRQIVTNLLGNAIKYTETGHVVVRARAAGQEDGRFRLRVEVEDTGLGIPEAEISSVFEAFTQVDSFETRKHGGTGLGLAITRQLVSLLGGEVGVVSRLAQGSTFWFELPLARAVRPPRREAWSVPPMTVLLVEPHAQAAAAITSLLEAAGAAVEVVATGERAFERLAVGEPVGLVVTDGALPDMKGSELLERLRSSGLAAVPVVMLAPAAAAGRPADVAACEPDAWLAKPVIRSRLAEAVDRALGLGAAGGTGSGDTSSSIVRSLGLKVLLVEDSPVNQEVACGMLEALGCEVVVAADGTLGVEYALGRPFDVVLMDCQMPLMDGYEATRKIRTGEAFAGRRPVPIVAITANALPGDRERCLASGMTDFVSKPFTLRRLQAVMQAVTGKGGGEAATSAATGTTAALQGLPVIEVGQIEELRSLGRPQIVRQVILLFLKQAAQKLEELDSAIARGALLEVEQAAHSLKSASLSVGGRRFAGAAGDCESAASAGDAGRAAQYARRLRPEFRALCRALSALAQADERAA